MRRYQRVLVTAIGVLLVGSGAQGWAGPEAASGRVKSSAAAAPVREAQVQPAPGTAPATPGAPVAPKRTETIVYDSWTVTCQDTVGGTAKKKCIASLRVMNQNQNRRQVLLNWQIGFNEDGRFVTAVHAPSGLAVKKDDKMVGGTLLIPDGVELKFGNGPVRRLSYMSCNPEQCLAEAPIDDAFIKEAIANGKATITIHTGGGPIPFDLTIKGIDKAISSTRT